MIRQATFQRFAFLSILYAGCFLSYSCGLSNNKDLEISQLEAAARSHPDDAKVQGQLGYAYERAGQYQQAVDTLTRAINLSPNDAKVYYTRGYAFGQLGRQREAIDDCTKAIDLDPKNAAPYLVRVYG